MTSPHYDHEFLEAAIELARENVRSGKGGPFGSVVVKEGKIIGRGENRVTSSLDPSAHAEIVAIRDACQQQQNFSLAGTTIYASCQPCPMCLSAIYWSRIDRVVFAASGDDAAAAGFDDEWILTNLKLPLGEQPLTIERLVIDGHKSPFQLWAASPGKMEY
ncbi:CMP/dCMP deaminase zinc-binding protein [Pirellula staleyi DSM 6068]|uniref:CMP/dCMP deaminase zinc-binding protein n=1 Tax=Pirellula staleyi (strain ATCC 27377 / DSM 6068 / ICPB 4128) TaxID=530564 RepID=D2QZ02_PIRSD|nr:nucleoside deaminase [Pirellula staleyi]ADB16457.1 CMP/dCMP deaminase zinc-binding protein [Pirellula staleyi DSM 6068]